MLGILLSHWAIYAYTAYVLVLVVLCIIYRPRTRTFYKNVQHFRSHARRMTPRMGLRQFH